MAARYLLLLVFLSISTSFIVHSLKMNLIRTTPNEIEGETTSFTCAVDGMEYGYLGWVLNGRPLDPSPCSGSEDPNQICLDITLNRNNSGKNLKCTTVGEYKNIAKTLQLNILHPPDVVTLEANWTSGLIYKFNCTASGANPAVNITWLINIKDVQSREDIVSRHNPVPYMWTTSSSVTLRTNTIADDEGIICTTSFLDNDSYVVRELLLDPSVEGTSLIIEASTTQPKPDEKTSTTQPDERTSTTKPNRKTSTTRLDERPSTSQPDEGTPITQPDKGTSPTQPDERTSTTQPNRKTSTTRPNRNSSTTQPDEGTSTTQPEKGTSLTQPDERTSTSRPNRKSSTTQPDEGTLTDKSVIVTNYVIVTISVVVCLCVAMVIVRRFQRKRKSWQPSRPINEDTNCLSAEWMELEESGFELPGIDYSFPRENIELLEVLGCGNFGQVYKAIAEDILEVGTKTRVAVKILKKSSSCNLLADFEKEFTVHKTLTKHPNVVFMLGYCTEKDPFYLILELLPGGNLQDYLRKKKLSWKESKEEDLDVEPASPYQLLTFASQIANGMDYLSFKGCIHRDLASRNILLSEDLVCKLSNFGLARDVSATEQYEMTSEGLVPVRWLAMECLLDNTYTTMSDVWSFGVLLWEIATLGAHPYRGMSYTDIINCLVEGHRLPQPIHCSKQLFSIMKDCWKEVPRTRPTFLTLKRTLDVMIADAPMYVNMSNFQSDKYL